MNIQAVANNVRISPRKVRLVADAIRNLGVIEAMNLLQSTDKQAGTPLSKTLKSAVANAVNNAKLDSASLYVSTIMVNQGQAFKRFRPSTRGRIHPYKKRGSNITIILTQKPSFAKASDGKVVAKAEEKKEIKGGKE